MKSALRQQANRRILERLILEVEQHPELRFGQILVNLKVIEVRHIHHSPTDWDSVAVDPFHEESLVTLSRMPDPI